MERLKASTVRNTAQMVVDTDTQLKYKTITDSIKAAAKKGKFKINLNNTEISSNLKALLEDDGFTVKLDTGDMRDPYTITTISW